MTWFNSAGNSAGRVTNGSYWRGPWVDTDGDDVLEFAPGDELLGFTCAFVNGLRWSDWGADRTDYDLYILDTPSGPVEASSANAQGPAGGPPPLEHANCSGSDVDYLAITRFGPNVATSGDVLEFMLNNGILEYWQNPFSATGPASDLASPGALSIGAVDPAVGVTIGEYSSEGPTNDGRRKPDLSAAACVLSFTFAPDCFNGTSAATPVAAGAGAVVLGARAATTPATLKTYLTTVARVDRGVAGADNVYGAGELVLPVPPTPTPLPTPSPQPLPQPRPQPLPPAPKLADVTLDACKRKGRGGRARVVCSLKSFGAVAQAKLTLKRGRRTVKRGTLKPSAAGQLSMRVGRAFRPGRYKLTITLIDAARTTRKLTKTFAVK